MNVEKLYSSKIGRILMALFLKSGLLKLAEKYMRSSFSKRHIDSFINKNHIDMREFEGVEFHSFSDFFKREKEVQITVEDHEIVSPADSMVSILDIHENSIFKVKNTSYYLKDFLKDESLADEFKGGLCLIFRLRATDYHHYCSIDDAYIHQGNYIEGTLHSVQPIVYEHFEVFKTNRRSVMVLDSKHLGKVGYISVGAVLVGGLMQTKNNCDVKKGQEVGYFDLIGSTVVILINKEAKDKLVLLPKLKDIINQDQEIEVRYASVIGTVKN